MSLQRYRGVSTTQAGVSLVELVIFIVIMAIAAVIVLRTFFDAIGRSPSAGQITQATQLAQERMELILAQRRVKGYSTVSDPCFGSGTPPAICGNAAARGYTILQATITTWPVISNINQYRQITVTVNGPTGTQLAEVTTVVGLY